MIYLSDRVKGPYMLCVLVNIYVFAELGHFLIGVTSRTVAQDLEFGNKGCLLRGDIDVGDTTATDCEDASSEIRCYQLGQTNATEEISPCTWDYTGSGLEYQILAGPAFIAVFTVTGIIWGIIADKTRLNRVHLLSGASIVCGLATAGSGFASKYWHLVILRMIHAAGEAACNPIAAGMISDIFDVNQRGLAMSLFTWGIYIGFGLSYSVGNYVTDANILDQSWRSSFVLSGIPSILFGILLLLTVLEPPRTSVLLDSKKNECSMESSDESIAVPSLPKYSAWNAFRDPAIIVLVLASSVRQIAGFTWSYNSALYFQTYFPSYNAGWWLTGTSVIGGTAGAAIGGFISDRLISKMGIPSRAIVLGISQLLSCPITLGVLYTEPPYAFILILFGLLTSGMWFGVMFAILVELVPKNVRATAVTVTLFIINNVGGNIPVAIDPLKSALGFRSAVAIMYSGSLFMCSILFFICCIILRLRRK